MNEGVIREEATLPLLAASIVDWAGERNLLGPTASPLKQIGKTREEVEETQAALDEWNSYLSPEDNSHLPGFPEAYNNVLMELGDVLVTCIVLANQLGSSASECLELAYEKISQRRGWTIDGVFVKEEDLSSLGPQ